jgi:ABC-type bacteriocin/lantibiotic exporter with double-glycine peptidase domain
MRARARLIVPEVVQTSNMDCGPAALKCLLGGFGIRANYGRLREACQTDVDGTSIDTLEEVACELGLDAEQVVVPVDHVLLEQAECLPAIAVVVLASGVTHFVVAWRRHGRLVQVMDPAAGRRFVPIERFRGELFAHEMTVDAAYWREYAGSEKFLVPLRARLADLGGAAAGEGLLAKAIGNPGWSALAALDAGVRMTASLVGSGAIDRGTEAMRVLETFLASPEDIPEQYWFAKAAPKAGDGSEQVLVRGAVLVRALGRAAADNGRKAPASPELIAALEQPPSRPGRDLIQLLRADGVLTPFALLSTLALASGGVLLEAVLLRGLVGAARQTITPLLALLIFSFALLLLELPLASGLLRLGRRLEIRLRLAFLRKIPRLGDRYFQSRLKSDMAERSHSIHLIRRLPELGGQLVRSIFELVLTTAGILWLDPASAPIALLAAFVSLAIPIAAQPVLMERDLRLRTHSGALSHFYLDALLGLFAIHSHGAQPAVRRSHESLLVEWARAGLNLQRLAIALESMQFVAGFGLAIWLLMEYTGRHAETGAILLLVYWALNLPALGQDVAIVAWQYPSNRNITLRLMEPLGAVEQASAVSAAAGKREPASSGGAALKLENVSVRAAGHTILREINLEVPGGQHVAIIGHSGAGKSSLAGILLGWHRPAEGRVLVDGEALDEARLASLRREVAWVDPAVHVWNRSLEENLRYGCANSTQLSVEEAIQAADLANVLRKLPREMETPLGEAGGLLSGGEGQRVRFARALMRPGTRLAILDEPFRGLDLDQRRLLLARARDAWRDATLLCITHDVAETLRFERVLVIEDGRIVEDGKPSELAEVEQSRFRAMLDAGRAVQEGLWMDRAWRHVRLECGELREQLP